MKPYLDSDILEIVHRLGGQVERFSGCSILLTGGHGFLGSHYTAFFRYLNEHILPKPCALIVLDNHITSSPPDSDLSRWEGYRFVHHDVTQPFASDVPLDYIIHAAGIASPYHYSRHPLETLEVSTLGTKNLLALGTLHKLKGFLYFSSSEIYGDPDEKHVPTSESYRGNVSCLGPRACYDEAKRLGETLCFIFHRLYGVPLKIVRPFNVYGPGMSATDYRVLPGFASRVVGGKPLDVYSSGKQTRTFCYVTDALVGFFRVLLDGHPGEVYNIGNPAPEISILELASVLERVMDRTLEVRFTGYPDAYPADEPQRRCPDIRKAALQLDYRPCVGLEEGLGRFMGWALKNYAACPP